MKIKSQQREVQILSQICNDVLKNKSLASENSTVSKGTSYVLIWVYGTWDVHKSWQSILIGSRFKLRELFLCFNIHIYYFGHFFPCSTIFAQTRTLTYGNMKRLSINPCAMFLFIYACIWFELSDCTTVLLKMW